MSSDTPATGRLLIFTAPSGAGKTTIVHHLLDRFPQLAFSVSATTRPPRPGEVNGEDYYFLSQQEFDQAIANDHFAEWEEVYPGRRYGTLKSEIERLWQLDKIIIFDIEVKGATNLKKAFPENSLAVFVQPPSPDILFERLRKRATEDKESLRVRIARAALELTYAESFDHIMVNDDLETTLQDAEEIVAGILDNE
ncbi:MAG: guanylate kinase [Bacteroidota bacterium]